MPNIRECAYRSEHTPIEFGVIFHEIKLASSSFSCHIIMRISPSRKVKRLDSRFL
ncbi:hypothetical protein AJ81_07610 [Pseudothermotoga hypogea DSM 11164 = NBRC 106472]|uniref:Uncharacterized protein n=1 Tax=Pseudothermotoga hypogea DSM 11164 = NBRC 106472 TaxID=1123384 RepID=A0A0X1KU27_9THEM|nr:hypothetical protein AJ81_07610 [Pseudothermotoga hypogea DSM 11164 = NBRC 106472]